MSQMNNVTSRNLFEFGDYFKKSLVLGLIAVILSPLIFGLLWIMPLGAGFLGFVLLGALIAVLVFQIMMLIRLYRAKESSPHPELIRTFTLMIVAIIVSVAGIIGSYVYWVVEWLSNVAAIVLQMIAWQSLAKYLIVYSNEANPSEGFPTVAEGIKSYVMFTYVSLGISVVNLILGFFPNNIFTWDTIDTILIIVRIAAMVIAIIIIVAQFKIANGIKLIFSGTPAVQPTSQQYGTPVSSVQPSIPSAQKERYCSKCGTKIVGEAKFCTSCGEALE